MPNSASFRVWLENDYANDSVKFIGTQDGRIILGRPMQSHEEIFNQAKLPGTFDQHVQNNIHGWLTSDGMGGWMGMNFYSYPSNTPVIPIVCKALMKTYPDKVGKYFIVTPEGRSNDLKPNLIKHYLSMPDAQPTPVAKRSAQDIERDRWWSELQKAGVNPSTIHRARTHPDYYEPREHKHEAWDFIGGKEPPFKPAPHQEPHYDKNPAVIIRPGSTQGKLAALMHQLTKIDPKKGKWFATFLGLPGNQAKLDRLAAQLNTVEDVLKFMRHLGA